MLTQILTTVRRSQSTLLQDVLGVGALAIMLVTALHLPGMI